MPLTTKRRITLPTNSQVHDGAVAPKALVLQAVPGPVTVLDKAKGYYKGIIAALGSLVIIINEVTPLFNFLPGQDKHYVTVAVAVVTGVLTFLKSNEHWVDDL